MGSIRQPGSLLVGRGTQKRRDTILWIFATSLVAPGRTHLVSMLSKILRNSLVYKRETHIKKHNISKDG